MAETEHVAEALWQAESMRATGNPRRIEWSEESDKTQDSWRYMANAAIAAWNRRPPDPAVAELVEALTPSRDTKAAYIGEFSFPLPTLDARGCEVTFTAVVPWTTIKEIMAAILARALLAKHAAKEPT